MPRVRARVSYRIPKGILIYMCMSDMNVLHTRDILSQKFLPGINNKCNCLNQVVYLSRLNIYLLLDILLVEINQKRF
jgi:hypothetical protein